MDENYWTRLRRQRLNRRRFLAASAAAAGTGFLIACGGDRDKGETGGTQGAATQAPGATPAAGAQGTPVPKGGAISTATVGTDAKGFHPWVTTDAVSSTYYGLISDTSLVRYNPETLEVEGNAAEKFTISDDKKTYTFTLRDMKWSDGKQITAEDYVWTFEQAVKPENKNPRLNTLKQIVSYKALDPKTLEITTSEAFFVGITTPVNWVSAFPKHVWEKYPWGDPAANPEILKPSVVSGPWKLKEWQKDQFATFVANESYWGGRPNLDQLTYRIFGTQALAYQELKAGEIDFLPIQPADVADAKKLNHINIYDYYAATTGYTYVGFNMRRPWAKDVNVRKALSYATDRPGIIESVAYGQARPVYSIFTQSSYVYNPNVEKYDFDPKKAAEHFRMAGYTLDANKRLVKDGQQLRLKVLFNQGSNVREGIATVLQQQLGDLGVAVEVVPMEFQAYIDFIKSPPFDYDLFILGWTAGVDPDGSREIWLEESIPALNSGAYVNKRVEELFNQGVKEFNTEKRKQIFGEIQKLITEDPPYVFVYEGKTNYGVNKKIGGIKPTRLGILYNLDKWYLEK